MLEFTGERVIPGSVDPDLWNEHFSRYAFASRLSRGRRVVDLGCGAGYGSAELARAAAAVWGIDADPETIAHASSHYRLPNLQFLARPCGDTGLADASADLVVAFELIEHLADPEALLREARRLLTPSGQLILSTPNADYYQESRGTAGPNPFHHREYRLDEFRPLLESYFPHVILFEQNQTAALSFRPLADSPAATPIVQFEAAAAPASKPNFFLAVCASHPQLGSPHFLFVPSTANVLDQRRRHIALLEGELRIKQQWLDEALAKHQELVANHSALDRQLRQANDWAAGLNQRLEEKSIHIEQTERSFADSQRTLAALTEHLAVRDRELAEKVAHNQALAAQTAEYEEQLRAAARAIAERDRHAAQMNTLLQTTLYEKEEIREDRDAAVEACDRERNHLAGIITALQTSLAAAEATVEERTLWAQRLDAEVERLRAAMETAARSRWLRLGRRLSLGPDLHA